jgi:signal peptide peptidase SppA
LVINSPGGSAAQSEMLANYIDALAERKKIPVYAFIEDVAASGGYWIAAAADEIFCAKTSMVGSIGVVLNVKNFSQLTEKFGVQDVTVTSGGNKARFSPFRGVKDEDIQWAKSFTREIHQLFIDWVYERRQNKLRSEDYDLLFSGEFFTGEKALQLGLVDGHGTYTEVMPNIIGMKPRFIKIAAPRRGGLRGLLTTQAKRPDVAGVIESFIQGLSVPRIDIG